MAPLQALRRFGPAALLLAALAFALALGVQDHLTVEALRDHHAWLRALVNDHPVLSLAAYTLGFTAFVCLCLPGLSLIAALGGLMFGVLLGGAAAVVAATLGACIVARVSHRAVGDLSSGRFGPVVRRLARGLKEHGVLYLMAARLMPLVPFWLFNLAAGCVRAPLRTFALGTALGIAPALFLYALLGRQLDVLFSHGRSADMSFFERPAVWLPLIALGLLSLAPLAVIALRRRRGQGHAPRR